MLVEEGKADRRGNQLRWAGYEVALTDNEREDQERLLSVYEKARLTPPTLEEAERRSGLVKKKKRRKSRRFFVARIARILPAECDLNHSPNGVVAPF